MSVYAPDVYSRVYCIIEMVLFVFFVFCFLRHKIKSSYFLNFNTLFLFSFGCVNYLHSAFIYPDDAFLPAFAFPYKTKVISYAVSVASVGIAAYMLGNILFENKISMKKVVVVQNRVVSLLEKIAIAASASLFFYVFFLLKLDYGLKHLYPRLMILIIALISLSCYYKAVYLEQIYGKAIGFRLAVKNNRLNILAILLFSLSLLSIGSRGSVIFLALCFMGIMNKYYFKLKARIVIPFFLLSILFMSILTLTRTTSINLSNSSIWDVVKLGYEEINQSANPLWLVLLDLIVNARTLYGGIEYTMTQGYLYGTSYVQYLFCFIPGGGIFITNFLLGKTTLDVNTGYVLTDFSNASFGLGTNMIGDMYMNYSFIGVIVALFLLGVLVSKCENCETKSQSLLYYSLLANSIYIPRASVFCWLDLFVMMLLAELLFKSVYRQIYKI